MLWLFCVLIQKFECIWLVRSNKKLDNKLHLLCELIHGGSTYYIETSPFICRANQWTGFFMIDTSVVKELNQNVVKSKQDGNDKFSKSTFTISDQCWHSVNLFYCNTYVRSVFRTQPNIYNKVFLWFLQRRLPIDVQVGPKYASAYIYIQVSLTEVICIFNIFAVKHIFSDKRRMK